MSISLGNANMPYIYIKFKIKGSQKTHVVCLCVRCTSGNYGVFGRWRGVFCIIFFLYLTKGGTLVFNHDVRQGSVSCCQQVLFAWAWPGMLITGILGVDENVFRFCPKANMLDMQYLMLGTPCFAHCYSPPHRGERVEGEGEKPRIFLQ